MRRFFLSYLQATLPVSILLTPMLLPGQTDHLVRHTEARTPAEELAGFKVPPGFKVQLFADESLIGGKPINMAFDAKGRLWVSSTQEYPYAIPKEKWSPDGTSAPGSKDSIRILEDTDGDGRADKVTVFADNLNIPTGVLPYKNGCIAWSIPNILHLEDTDNDGRADKRTVVLGPMGYELDTHGMVSSMRMGLDGWVYATHGFNNQSRVTASDGSTVEMHSGNTFRFRPDGSRIEVWTRGQVNPFGMCWDSWGNLYSADCHSSPIYQLIRGAFYPSFGKAHDGLGFAPVMCEHSHGSTGISGVVYLDGGVWGSEWDNHMLVGNPVTSKVNHDTITFTGTTPVAHEAPDFLTSEDGWFRPVDLHLGPDSALYVVDFYNRIIGHYEVALDHPGRDRARGRIWRVVKEGHTGSLTDSNLASMKADGLMRELASPNLTRRYLATEELIHRIGRPALALARQEVTGEEDAPGAPVVSDYTRYRYADDAGIQDVHAMWVAFRLGDVALPSRVARGLMGGGVRHTGERERLSAACITAIAEKTAFAPEDVFEGDATVCDAQFDARGEFSMRAAGLAIAHHPNDIRGALGILHSMRIEGKGNDSHLVLDSGDPALILTWRMAVRTWLSQPGHFDRLNSEARHAPGRLLDEVAFIACTIPSEESALWLLTYAKERRNRLPDPPTKLRHIARHLPAEREAELVRLVQQHVGEDLDMQVELYDAIYDGVGKQGGKPGPALTAWAHQLSTSLLQTLRQQTPSQWHPTVAPTPQQPNPWFPMERPCSDGRKRPLLDSHPPGGEKLTGTLRSGEFDVPAQLQFWIAGHSGFPKAEANGKNFVRLVDAATGAELARAVPPRHDTAQPVVWTFSTDSTTTQGGMLPRGSGRARLELSDGDSGNAYAWMAAGGFEPALPALAMPVNQKQRDLRIRALAGLSRETAAEGGALAFLSALPDKLALTADTRLVVATALTKQEASPIVKQLVALTADAELAPTVFTIIEQPQAAPTLLQEAYQKLPFRAQVKLATALAGSTTSMEQVLPLTPARVLADAVVAGKVQALNRPDLVAKLQEATAKLPPTHATARATIEARMKSFPHAATDEKNGAQVFQVNCAICHRIGVRGSLVGPQLDGIGVRGVERLLEDLLDPNRAVDPAFRLHFVRRKNGNLITGLYRREQDGVVIFADAAGQEHSVPKAEIVEDQVSDFSLMPAGFGELLSEKDLHDLLAYLLARK